VSLNLDVITKLGRSLLIIFLIDNIASETLEGVSSPLNSLSIKLLSKGFGVFAATAVSSPSNSLSIEFLSKGFGVFAAAAVLTSSSKSISLGSGCSGLRLFLLLLS
jgi:hypothetical protein